MKKFKVMCAVLTMAVAMTACGAAKPEDTATSVLECLQKNDLEGIKQYFSNAEAADFLLTGEDASADQPTYGIVADVLNDCAEENAGYIRFEITETVEKGDNATVAVKVTYKDAGPIAKIAMTDVLNQAVADAMNGGSADYDESDFVAYYIKAFENAKDKAAYVDKTETIELPCRKEDGKWEITEFAELSNIYYCNIINTYDKYFDGESGERDFIAETAGDEEAIENGETAGSEETAGLDEAAAASQETGADETQESMPADDDIRLFEEDGLKTTSLEFAVWDDTGEMYITMLYIGTNGKEQYVGNCTITVSDGDETESVEGVFVENDDETGTITIDNGNTADYSLIWDTDHYVMTIDMGGTFYNLLEAEWAYGNVG